MSARLVTPLSKGDDPIKPPLFFSVDRVAVGLPGSAVHAQAQPGVEEAAGDIFQTLPPVGSNTLVIDEQQLGLTPGFFGDDLDALDWANTASSPIFFSIDALSASNSNDYGFGPGCNAANIFKDNISTVWHSYIQMGLDCKDDLKDDLDALVYDAIDDIALFSLSPFSASTFTFTGLDYQAGVKYRLSPADILWTNFNGSFKLWASAADIGLRPDDNVDALETPEPGTLVLFYTGLIGLGFWLSRGKIHLNPMLIGKM